MRDADLSNRALPTRHDRKVGALEFRAQDVRCLLLAPLHADTAALLNPSLLWRPDLAGAPEGEVTKSLRDFRPRILAVGASPVRGPLLREWRQIVPEGPLYVVRRGTSLAAIDLEVARDCGIAVHNTRGVNSPYVASYVNDFLAAAGTGGKIAILGVGDIGRLVARRALERGFHLALFSRTLADPSRREGGLAALKLDPGQATCASSLDEAMTGARCVAVCLPLTRTGPAPTHHLIGVHQVDLCAPDVRLISVSEPEVFHPEALRRLHARGDARVLIDNAGPLLAEVLQILGVSRPRAGFDLQSRAMSSEQCQRDMDQAVLIQIAVCALQLMAAAEVSGPQTPGHSQAAEPIQIVGGGLTGIMTALELQRRGYREIEVVDASPEDLEWSRSGATYAQRCRHLSATETLPHSSPARRDILTVPPAEGGWRLRPPQSLSDQERTWAASFERMARRPALHRLCSDLVLQLNQLSLRAWDRFFDDSPETLEGVWFSRRILRLYLDEDSLQSGWTLQSAVNTRATRMGAGEVAVACPALLGAVERNAIAGAIEVDGYGVDIIQMVHNLRTHLVQRGVRFRHGRISARPAPPWSRMVFSPGAYGDVSLEPASAHVQGVVGCWLTLPNPGLTAAIKVHAPEPAGVLNFAPSRDGAALFLSGGFGYVGQQRPVLDDPEIQALFRRVEAAVAAIFPEELSAAMAQKTVDRRLCVRPMTPDGLPLVHADHATVYVGGASSGGATEAPLLAALAADLLAGQPSPVTAALTAWRPSLSARC
jgi:glycine/D-amino acid oxidase-like deaminating enzyme/phosphoglycerate dehydrogenase-like enzyme